MNYKGLRDIEVDERIKAGEVNRAQNKSTKSYRDIFRENVLTYFNFVNLVLFFFVCLTGKFRNGLFMGTIVFNACIGITQEIKAKRLLDRLSLIAERKTEVLRNDAWITISIFEIVKDDILRLHSGMQAAVDGEIIDGKIEVDESILSGESNTVEKNMQDIVYAGSIVCAGNAVLKVKCVGEECLANQILLEAQKEKRAQSVLNQDLERLIRIISVVIVPVGILLFLTQFCFIGLNKSDAMLKTVAAIVGMIPEGLVALTSVALAVSIIRLSKKNVLVQDLFSIESLARVDTVCFDKTGTLTKGVLQVADVIPLNCGEKELCRIMSSYLYGSQDNDATNRALKEYFKEEEIYQKSDVLPFSSDRKYAAAVLKDLGCIYAGAFSFLFLDRSDRRIEELTKKGYRVIVVAQSSCQTLQETMPDDLEMIGIISMRDELREDASKIIHYFKQEAVSVKIISGDDALTVASIAMRANIEGASNYIDMSKPHADYSELVDEYTVFARVRPEEKKELVRAMQKKGHRVLMSGDGVNDVPALKSADVSIAVNDGSDVAKNVSNIILLNNDFACVPNIIEEGRRVINNITRASSMYFVKTIFSLLLTLYVIVFHRSYPFLPIHLTIISAIGVGIPTFILQMEPSFERVSGNFLKHAFFQALPSAIAISITIIACLWMQEKCGYSNTRLNGIFIFLTGYIYLFTLFRVYSPFTKLRICVISLMCILLLTIVLCFGQFLSVSYHVNDITLLIAGVVTEPVLIYLIIKFLNQLERIKVWKKK